jgi:hypothetical protein
LIDRLDDAALEPGDRLPRRAAGRGAPRRCVERIDDGLCSTRSTIGERGCGAAIVISSWSHFGGPNRRVVGFVVVWRLDRARSSRPCGEEPSGIAMREDRPRALELARARSGRRRRRASSRSSRCPSWRHVISPIPVRRSGAAGSIAALIRRLELVARACQASSLTSGRCAGRPSGRARPRRPRSPRRCRAGRSPRARGASPRSRRSAAPSGSTWSQKTASPRSARPRPSRRGG